MWIQNAAARLAWIQSRLPTGRLLEIGSATGEFVAAAEKAGFDVVGIESSEWAVNASRDLTKSVIRADVGDWLQQQGGITFDGIVMLHMLEHVADPRTFLKPLVEALAPGGFVFIEVPNGDARDIRDGAQWINAAHNEHWVHYRKQDLESLLGSVGLRCQEFRTFTMKEYASVPGWAIWRLKLLRKGRLTPSDDFLRVVAVHG